MRNRLRENEYLTREYLEYLIFGMTYYAREFFVLKSQYFLSFKCIQI